MEPSEIKRELERLVADAEAARARLAALGERISAACELVVTVRSTLKGDERTPGEDGAQEQEPTPDRDEARAG
jgi:hypothetical protein